MNVYVKHTAICFHAFALREISYFDIIFIEVNIIFDKKFVNIWNFPTCPK
jgi:hypothetical protein